MSDDISREDAHSVFPIFIEIPDLPGHDGGWLWVAYRAGGIEKTNLFDVVRGAKSAPNFPECRDVDHAIQECVRVILPPAAFSLDSAKEYWHLITREEPYHPTSIDTQPYVDAFFQGALQCVRSLVHANAQAEARRWLARYARPEDLEHLERFVEQYGDTWEERFPDGCSSVFEVALYMAGRDLSQDEGHFEDDEGEPMPADPVRDYGIAFALISFSMDTVEFATFFVREVVAQFRRQQSRSDSPTEEEAG